MKILITGHKGFVGKNLFTQFTSVIGIDEKYDMKYINNFLDIHNPDIVFHIGACSDTLATDIGFVMERNYLSTKWITDWCITNNKKIIYASSAAVYGFDGKKPSNLYGWSKLMGEDYVVAKGGVALRYFNVYGPGEEHKGKMASMIYQNIKKKIVKLFPNKPKRDFVYVKDVISANIHAFENYKTLSGKYYEVGSGTARPFEDVMKTMNIPFEYHEETLIPKGYQFYTCSNKIKWMKGWESKWTLENGLKDYFNLM